MKIIEEKYFSEEEIRKADNSDLAEFLQKIGEKVKRAGKEYQWSGQQIKINGCVWYNHYRKSGGKAIKFLCEEFGMSEREAIKTLLESDLKYIPSKKTNFTLKKKKFVLPEPNDDMRRVFAYLIKTRGIDRDIVSYFAHKKLIYEDKEFHNVVFVDLDENQIPRHAHKKSTAMVKDSYRGNQSGLESDYSFHHIGTNKTIYVFEAPIDMLSMMSLQKENWQEYSYVALCSISDIALMHQLKINPKIVNVFLCLDNDKAGIKATKNIKKSLLEKGYKVFEMFPNFKDWNESLLNSLNTQSENQIPQITY